MGGTLLRKAPDSSGSDNLIVISLCVLLAKRFSRSFVGLFKQVLFKVENVELICLLVLIGLG